MKHTGVIVDIETTGLNPAEDRIIEIGLVTFSFSESEAPVITNIYGSLEDPGCEIPEQISKLTLLTTAQLRGQKIDWTAVRQILSAADVVIAHNAKFEKGFLRVRPELEGLADRLFWACSMSHVDWDAHGFRSRALTYIAADMGFINPFPHRAPFDCVTTFKIIGGHLPELIERAHDRDVTIKAVGAPYETKDVLKARGYRWNPGERVWQKVIRDREVEAERKFLTDNIYKGEDHHLEQVDAA